MENKDNKSLERSDAPHDNNGISRSHQKFTERHSFNPNFDRGNHRRGNMKLEEHHRYRNASESDDKTRYASTREHDYNGYANNGEPSHQHGNMRTNNYTRYSECPPEHVHTSRYNRDYQNDEHRSYDRNERDNNRYNRSNEQQDTYRTSRYNRDHQNGEQRSYNRNERDNNRYNRSNGREDEYRTRYHRDHQDGENRLFNYNRSERPNNRRYDNNSGEQQEKRRYRRDSYGQSFRHDTQQGGDHRYSHRKQEEYRQQFTDPNKPVRLNKFLANAGICSRREADEFIEAGVVKVNGEVVTEMGIKIMPATDKVYFHDQPVQSERKVYILLNKPKNCVTTSDDPQERLTVLDLVNDACTQRVYPVGRLDRNTTGVILITNDGDLASRLTHPKYDKKKIYQLKLDKPLTEEDMQTLLNGVILEDGEVKADDISYSISPQTKQYDRQRVGIEIHSGKNRIVRRMFESLGYHVTKLDRVFFAGLTKKNLARGKWRYLSEKEVAFLKMNNGKNDDAV